MRQKSQDILWKSWVQSRFWKTVQNEHNTTRLDFISHTNRRFKAVCVHVYVRTRASDRSCNVSYNKQGDGQRASWPGGETQQKNKMFFFT